MVYSSQTSRSYHNTPVRDYSVKGLEETGVPTNYMFSSSSKAQVHFDEADKQKRLRSFAKIFILIMKRVFKNHAGNSFDLIKKCGIS